MKNKLNGYLKLMKPSIMLLVLVTGATSLVLEGSLLIKGWSGLIDFGLIMAGLLLTGGSANAFNMYLERDIDALMTRTSKHRPLPQGLISPRPALIFAVALGLGGICIFLILFNLLSAILALGTILFYSFFYTLYLKPRTPYNIVIGGIAGSMAPVIAWAATTGSIMLTPLLLFLIVLLWTPPHFWALALHMKSDYELVKYPMMPIAAGDKSTKRQMLGYAIGLTAASASCVAIGAGPLYLLIALLAGAIFVVKIFRLLRQRDNLPALKVFKFSIIYLFSVFGGLMADKIISMVL